VKQYLPDYIRLLSTNTHHNNYQDQAAYKGFEANTLDPGSYPTLAYPLDLNPYKHWKIHI